MPARGLKIVGTGACLRWCSISFSFQNSLKMSGDRGYEFLEFRRWNLVPFLPGIDFQLLKSLWSSLTYFSFNDAPNVLYRFKIWTASRPIQHPDSSTTKPRCCNSCSMWFCICTPCHQRCWLLNWMLITSWKFSPFFRPEGTFNKNIKFGLVWPFNNFLLWNSPF